MTILDANVWIAFFHASDTQHTKARNVLARTAKPILIPEYVVIEVCTILERLAGHVAMCQFLEIALGNREAHVIPMKNEEFFNLLKIISENRNHPLSFIDISLLVLSKSHTVITFDKKLTSAINKTSAQQHGR